MAEPIPVIPLTYADPVTGGTRGGSPVLAVIAWGICVVACVLLVGVDTETVVATGPAVFLAGTVMVVHGVRRRDRWTWILGLAHCAICAFFVVLVNLYRWGPGDAHVPFAVMGVAYTLAVAWPTYMIWARRRAWAAGAA